MTDMEVIKYLQEEREKDFKFMQGNISVSEKEYKAYHKGQEVGISRAMAYLRQKGILKPCISTINGTKVKQYRF